MNITICAFRREPCDGQAVSFTVSIGVTGIVPSDTSIDSALKRADTAMYAAKSGGRNQVRLG